MKKIQDVILKGFLLVGIATMAVSSARAQYALGDAMVAFTTGTGNDLIYDLGPVSSLYQGETFSLGSLLTGNLAIANHPVWAVVAADNSNIYTSYADPSSAPPSITGGFTGLKNSIAQQIGNNIMTGSGAGAYGVTNASAQYSFAYDNSSTSPDGSTLANSYSVVGATNLVQDFWVSAKNSGGTPGAVTQLYNWTLASDGTLTYGAGVVSTPQLKISLSGANYILSATNATGFTLQSNTNLAASASWSAVSPQPAIVSGQFTVTNPISGTFNFFRLKQ